MWIAVISSCQYQYEPRPFHCFCVVVWTLHLVVLCVRGVSVDSVEMLCKMFGQTPFPSTGNYCRPSSYSGLWKHLTLPRATADHPPPLGSSSKRFYSLQTPKVVAVVSRTWDTPFPYLALTIDKRLAPCDISPCVENRMIEKIKLLSIGWPPLNSTYYR